jgi:hypothetical protein
MDTRLRLKQQINTALRVSVLTTLLAGCVHALPASEEPREYSGSKGKVRLLLTAATNTSVHYKISGGETCMKNGTAVRDVVLPDPEIDIDESGLAYPSFEYLFGDQCLVRIRVKVNFKPTFSIGDRVILSFLKCETGREKCEVMSTEVLNAE